MEEDSGYSFVTSIDTLVFLQKEMLRLQMGQSIFRLIDRADGIWYRVRGRSGQALSRFFDG